MIERVPLPCSDLRPKAATLDSIKLCVRPFWRRLPLTKITVLLSLAVCCVAGCSMPGAKQEPAKRTYLLQGTKSIQATDSSGTRPCLSLRVSMPAASPGFGSTRMAYTEQPARLAYFAYHEWVDTPSRMVAAMLEGHLEASGLFRAVLTGSSDIRTDLRLDTEITSLRQDFNGKNSTLVFGIKVGLVDVSSRLLMTSRSFEYAEAADEANPESGVAAANRAADRFLKELTDFVAGAISDLACPDGNQPAD